MLTRAAVRRQAAQTNAQTNSQNSGRNTRQSEQTRAAVREVENELVSESTCEPTDEQHKELESIIQDPDRVVYYCSGLISIYNESEYNIAKSLQCFQEHLSCAICKELLEDPMLHPSCKNLFCSKCIGYIDDKRCPICRTTASYEVAPLAISNIIAELDIECSRCEQQQKFGQFKTHYSTKCPNMIVSCEAAKWGCEWIGFRSSFLGHQNECKVIKNPLYFHLLECELRLLDNQKSHCLKICENLDNLRIGDLIDAKDCKNMWYQAVVIDVAFDFITVNYLGWREMHNERLLLCSENIAPLNTKSKGKRGPGK